MSSGLVKKISDNSTMNTVCPMCSKAFKNLRLHITKAHHSLDIKLPKNENWVNDGDIPEVKYADHTLEHNGVCYESGDKIGFEYELPAILLPAKNPKYYAVCLYFSNVDGCFISANYCMITIGKSECRQTQTPFGDYRVNVV